MRELMSIERGIPTPPTLLSPEGKTNFLNPPSSPTWNFTVAQVPFNGPNGGTTFVDQFGTTLTTAGAATTSTATSVFNGSSGYFTGVSASDSVAAPASTLYDLGSREMTLEGWFLTSQNTQQYTTLCSHSSSSFEAGAWMVMINALSAGDGKLAWWMSDYSTSAPLLVGTIAHNDGKWHHVSVNRTGNYWLMFVDGLQEASVVWSGVVTSEARDLMFGNGHFFNRTLLGNLASWRLVVGRCLYTSNYTVPSAPFATS